MSNVLDFDWSKETDNEEREREENKKDEAEEQEPTPVVEQPQQSSSNLSSSSERNTNSGSSSNQNFRSNSGNYKQYNNNNGSYQRNNQQRGGYNNQQGGYQKFNNQNNQNNQNNKFRPSTPRNEMIINGYPSDTTKEEIIELLKSNGVEFNDINFLGKDTIVQLKDSDHYLKTKSLDHTSFKSCELNVYNYNKFKSQGQQQNQQQQQQPSQSYFSSNSDSTANPQDFQSKPKANPFGEARPIDHLKRDSSSTSSGAPTLTNSGGNVPTGINQAGQQPYKPRQSGNTAFGKPRDGKPFDSKKNYNKIRKEQPDSEGFVSVKGSNKSTQQTSTQSTNTPKKLETTKNMFSMLNVDDDEEN